MRSGRRALAGVVLLLASACSPLEPSQPDVSAWQTAVAVAVEDMVSQLSTAQIVLREQAEGDFIGKAATVVLVEAEDAAGTASDDLTTLQPPPGVRKQQAAFTALLEEAAGLVTEARVAVVDDDVTSYETLRTQLQDVKERILAQRGDLR